MVNALNGACVYVQVGIHVIKSQEHPQKFVKFMRENLPRVEVKVSRDDKGMYIINLTNLTKGCKDGQNAGNDGNDCVTACSGSDA